VPHLHLLELGAASAPGKVRDLFEGTTFELPRGGPGVEHFDVSPDGSSVVFAFDPAPEKRQDGRRALAEMDIATRQVQVIVQDAGWDLSGPCYSPDGQRIAFTASHQAVKHTMPTQLAVWERESHTWDVVSAEWDHAVRDPLHWEDDGQALLFTAEQKGCTHLWRFDLPDRRAEVVVRGGSVSGFDKSSGTLVTVADSVMHPARAHAHAPGETPLRLESFNDALLARLDLGRAEAVWLKGASAAALAKDATGGTGGTAVTGAAEGDDVQMWVVHPPAFDARKKYPALHCIHGGPHTGPGDNWHYRWNMHLFAAQGFVVASVNYHGSSGFGQAFLDSITHRWGELELQDIEAGTDWLLARPYIDSRRIFASGGSYGGFMVAWMNGHLSNQSPGRYQAYVCHAGCYDWVAMFADDAWAWHAKELGHWYWDDLARVQAQSPMAFAGTMSTPTLVIHGALDYRVPDAQGLAFYNTLKARGVDSRLLWFPDENHWILKPQNSRLWHAEFFAWLARHDPGTRRRRSNPRA
jgi:dipeptidyl aminopeptidase/acylaminoacyl peptidase